MKTIGFLLLGAFVGWVVGLVGSVLLGLISAIYYPITRVAGRRMGLTVITLVNAFFMLSWTAVLVFWLKANTPPYDPAYWAAVIVVIFVATAPITMAHKSTIGVMQNIGATEPIRDMFSSLHIVFFLQLVGGVAMLFVSDVLKLWDWLPLPESWEQG